MGSRVTEQAFRSSWDRYAGHTRSERIRLVSVELGCSRATVYNKLREFGLETGTTGEPVQTAEPTPAKGNNVAEALGTLFGPAIADAVAAALTEGGYVTAEDVEALVASRAPKVLSVQVPGREPVKVEGAHQAFPELLSALGAGEDRVYLYGPRGTGKTHAAEQAAETLGMAMFLVTPISDRVEVQGYCDAQGRYVTTQVRRWADHEGPACLILDEVDGFLPEASLAMNAMLANSVGVFADGQKRIPEHHAVIATANTLGLGATANYTGRSRQDLAFLDRFPVRIPWHVDEKVEFAMVQGTGVADPEAAQNVAHNARRVLASRNIQPSDVSPRSTRSYARLLAGGWDRKKAAMSTILSLVPDERREEIAGEVL